VGTGTKPLWKIGEKMHKDDFEHILMCCHNQVLDDLDCTLDDESRSPRKIRASELTVEQAIQIVDLSYKLAALELQYVTEREH